MSAADFLADMICGTPSACAPGVATPPWGTALRQGGPRARAPGAWRARRCRSSPPPRSSPRARDGERGGQEARHQES
eukprot:scaffold62472_cov69-Phaeocystis_antarctica.AAC.2